MATDNPRAGSLPEGNVLSAFFLFILVGGGASVAIRFTYAELAPFWAATFRFGVAAVVFWILASIQKIPFPKGNALLGAVIFGTLTVGLAFILIAWGLVSTPASLYQTLMATVPLLTIFLSSIHGVESITRRGLAGSLLVLVGIAVAVGTAANRSNLSVWHIVAILLAATALAEGGVLIKRFPPNPPVMTNAIAMTAGTFILGAASLIAGEPWVVPTQAATWTALIYLILFVTLIAFLLYMYVLSNWTASGTSYGFVLIPLVTIVVAATLAGEVITINFLLGAALVLAGVFLGALLPSNSRPAEIEECKSRSGQVLPRCS